MTGSLAPAQSPRLDPKHIGHTWATFEAVIERGRVIAFAEALGAADPIFKNVSAAQSAGYRSIPVLPTFPITLTGLDVIYDLTRLLGIDPAKILHGSQKFIYHGVVCAGDVLTGQKRIAALYDRKGGALSFIETITGYRDAGGQLLCEDHCTLVVRNT